MSGQEIIKMTTVDGTVFEGAAEEIRKIARMTEEGGFVKIGLGETRIGDYVKFDRATRSYLSGRTFYEVIHVDKAGDAIILDDDGDEFDTCFSSIKAYRKVLEEEEEEEAYYGKFKEGDRVRLALPEGSTARFGMGDVSNGSVGTVVGIHDGVYVIDFDEQRCWKGMESELVKAGEEEEEAQPLKPGDFAKVVGETLFAEFTTGKVVEVIRSIDSDGDLRVEAFVGNETICDYAKPSALEKISATPREADFLKAGREIDEFKPGDIAEVLESPSASAVGSLVEILDVQKATVKARGVSAVVPNDLLDYAYRFGHLKPRAFAHQVVGKHE